MVRITFGDRSAELTGKGLTKAVDIIVRYESESSIRLRTRALEVAITRNDSYDYGETHELLSVIKDLFTQFAERLPTSGQSLTDCTYNAMYIGYYLSSKLFRSMKVVNASQLAEWQKTAAIEVADAREALDYLCSIKQVVDEFEITEKQLRAVKQELPDDLNESYSDAFTGFRQMVEDALIEKSRIWRKKQPTYAPFYEIEVPLEGIIRSFESLECIGDLQSAYIDGGVVLKALQDKNRILLERWPLDAVQRQTVPSLAIETIQKRDSETAEELYITGMRYLHRVLAKLKDLDDATSKYVKKKEAAGTRKTFEVSFHKFQMLMYGSMVLLGKLSGEYYTKLLSYYPYLRALADAERFRRLNEISLTKLGSMIDKVSST